MKSNNDLEIEASDITDNITESLKEEQYFIEFSGIDETIFKKHLKIFILDKITNSEETEFEINEAELYKISADSAQESIEVLVNKTIMEKQGEIEKLIQSTQFTTNGIQKNRRGTKTNE
jgi:hypothetical protein